MMPDDPDALLICPLPSRLMAALDALAVEERCDRTALVTALLGDALRLRAIGRAVEDVTDGAVVIAFPRPSWAVDGAGGDDA